jgi:hypothetical protein
LALPTLLYGCETWIVREQDKSRMTSAEIKLIRRRANYTRQDYKTNEDILPELKINQVEKKIKNYKNEWIQHVRRTYRDILAHLITKYQACGIRSQGHNGNGTGHEA